MHKNKILLSLLTLFSCSLNAWNPKSEFTSRINKFKKQKDEKSEDNDQAAQVNKTEQEDKNMSNSENQDDNANEPSKKISVVKYVTFGLLTIVICTGLYIFNNERISRKKNDEKNAEYQKNLNDENHIIYKKNLLLKFINKYYDEVSVSKEELPPCWININKNIQNQINNFITHSLETITANTTICTNNDSGENIFNQFNKSRFIEIMAHEQTDEEIYIFPAQTNKTLTEIISNTYWQIKNNPGLVKELLG